jgi:phage gp36-like protein
MATTPYAAAADFRKHFGETETAQLTDFDNEGGENAAALGLALKDATDEINSYLAARYTVPLAAGAVLGTLTRTACDIARYRLYKDRPTDEVAERYKGAVRYLKDLASGTAQIIFDPPLTDEVKATAETPMTAYGTYQGGVFGTAVFDRQPGSGAWPN